MKKEINSLYGVLAIGMLATGVFNLLAFISHFTLWKEKQREQTVVVEAENTSEELPSRSANIKRQAKTEYKIRGKVGDEVWDKEIDY